MAATKVALLGVPYDASSSYQRGSAGAPVVIREALWSESANTWTENGGSIVRSPTPGPELLVSGKVLDAAGKPIECVEVDVWQSSPVGLY